ncbi:hypothetical protein D3C84_913830 [compost metagenome]
MLGLRILLLREHGHTGGGNQGLAVFLVETRDAYRVDQFDLGAVRIDLTLFALDVPRELRAAEHVQVGVGQQRHFGRLQVLDLVRRHFILQLAVGQVLHAVGVDGVVVDCAVIDPHDRLVEEAFRADVPIANRGENRRDAAEHQYVANLFAQHFWLTGTRR